MARNSQWKDNYALYSGDLPKLKDSAHYLFYYANHITGDEFLDALPDSMSREKG